MKPIPEYEHKVKITEIEDSLVYGKLMGGVIKFLHENKAPRELTLGLVSAVHSYTFASGEVELAELLGLVSDKDRKKLKKIINKDMAIVDIVNQYVSEGFGLSDPSLSKNSAFTKATEHIALSPETIRDRYYAACKKYNI